MSRKNMLITRWNLRYICFKVNSESPLQNISKPCHGFYDRLIKVTDSLIFCLLQGFELLYIHTHTDINKWTTQFARRKMRWMRPVARKTEMRSSCKILAGKAERKRKLGRPMHRWKDKIRMFIWGIVCEDVDWFFWLMLRSSGGLLWMNIYMNVGVPTKEGNLTRWANVSFSSDKWHLCNAVWDLRGRRYDKVKYFWMAWIV